MGTTQSRPEDRLRHISREVNSLKSSLRSSRQNISKERRDFIVSSLARHSSEVSSMNGKVRHKIIEGTLRNISEAMEEVLKIEPVELDRAAVESDSFVNVPLSHRISNSLGSVRSTRKSPKEQVFTNRSSIPTLRDIEAKVDDLKTQISTAMDNRDTRQLRVCVETLRVLATDLELIHTQKDTHLDERKENIDKKVMSLYYKANKAIKEVKRTTSSQNQSELKQKDQAMGELADIEVHLAENDSLLDKLLRERSFSEFAIIRNNILENNHKLGKVEIVDKEVKDKVVLLSQKINETVKTVDHIMAKREFDSKSSKSLENLERIVRNFDPNRNVEDTLNDLQSLRNSTQYLKEVDDISKNRKKELLRNISYQIDNISEAMQKQSDQKIIQEIVEDNVILRKKVRSTDNEYTVVDQFINYWNNVKSNFDVNLYSNFSLLRIDNVLEEMQQSIDDIRIGIAKKCDTNLPSNLRRKRSQSVPKLSTRNYGSSRSLDQLDTSGIIKTRAKVYNLSTPELQNVNLQQKQGTKNRFSEIEQIQLHANYIKEKIDGSHNKNLLRDKLEQYRKNLTEYLNDTNKTVQSNAILVYNEVTELLYRIVLAEFKENIDLLSKKVQNFKGTKYDKDYDEMKDDLLKLQLQLETFSIPNIYVHLEREKGELLDEVSNSIESLQQRSFYYRKEEDKTTKQYKAKLQELSDKVKRFSGTYKGVLYNNIERDLNKLLLDVGEHVEDKIWSDELTKETERLLKILEQRSSMAQSFRVRVAHSKDTKSEEQVGMTKIKRDLCNIRREIDRTSENNVDAFIGLQSRLDLVSLELSQIAARSNENLEKEKEIISNEAQTLKNVVDAKVALGQQPMVQWPERQLPPSVNRYPTTNVDKELKEYKNTFEAIKREITEPNCEQDVHKYYKLAQDIKNLMEKLGKYKFMRGTDLQIEQRGLLEEMQYYVEALEQGAIDARYILSIEKNLDKLEHLYEEHDMKTMAKELQTIQKKLQEHKFYTTNETLRSRKTSVQQKTEDLAQRLKEIEDSEQHLQQEQKKINDIEEKARAITSHIKSFVGLKSDSKYYELNETIIRTILQLDNIDTEDSNLQNSRIKLLKELHALGQLLDERAQQTQDIVNIEEAMEEVSLILDNFSGKDSEIKIVKEKMEVIKRNLHGLRVINDLIPRKNACIETFSVLFNRVMALANSQDSSNHTTQRVQGNRKYTAEIYNSAKNDSLSPTTESDDILSTIEKKIENMEAAVITSKNVNELQNYDEALTRYTVEMHSLKKSKESPEYQKIRELYRKIDNITCVIDKQIEGMTTLEKVSAEVDEITSRMDSLSTYQQVDILDERLINLQTVLGKIKNESLKTQIDGCMLRIILCLQKISEFKSSVRTTQV